MKSFFSNLLSPFLSHPAWSGASVLIALIFSIIQVTTPSKNTKENNVNHNLYSKQGNWIDPITGMEFIWVAGNCFNMGLSKQEKQDIKKQVDMPWFYNNITKNNFRHKVCIDGYWIGKYEVTQKQWTTLLGNYEPSSIVNGPSLSSEQIKKILDKGDSYPVASAWHSELYESAIGEKLNALRFINKLNEKNRGKYFFRLPTEAEWEYACRSGGRDEIYAGGNNIDSVGWYKDNSFESLHRIGLKTPNGLGIYDMSGGVSEWVVDTCDGDSYLKHGYNNPVLVSDGVCQGLRGGGFTSESFETRCAMRWGSEAGSPGLETGFRLVRVQK